MDQAKIVSKIYYGYKQAALRLGAPYVIYRATSAINPIQDPNIPDDSPVMASFAVNWAYNKFQNYGNAIYIGIFDGRVTQVGDYLVKDDITYFIGSMEDVKPILTVRCNALITVKRPFGETTGGLQGYSGRTAETDVVKYQDVPASLLIKTTKGVTNNVGLPTDTRQPLYTCLIPYLGNVELLTGDLVFSQWDETPGIKNLVIWEVELTDLGYRLQLEELGA